MPCYKTPQSAQLSSNYRKLPSSFWVCLYFLVVATLFAFQSKDQAQSDNLQSDDYRADSLAIRSLMNQVQSWYEKKLPDSAYVKLQKAVKLNEATIQDKLIEAHIKQIFGWHHTYFGDSLDLAVQEYRSSIQLYIENNNLERAIRVGYLLASNYYLRKDSTILQLKPVSQEILDLFDELPKKDHGILANHKKRLKLMIKSGEAYEKVAVNDIPMLKNKQRLAQVNYRTAWNLHHKAGFPDSAAIFRQKALHLYEEILNQLDDPRIWESYLETRLGHYDYLSIAKLMPDYKVEQELDFKHLTETLDLVKNKLGSEQQSKKDDLICSLASHIAKEAPDQALEMLLSAPERWRCLVNIEELYQNLGNLEQAIAVDRRRFETTKSSRYYKALSSQDLALSLLMGGYFEEAEVYARMSLENLPNTIESTHARWAFAYHRLAASLTGQNKLSEALEMIEKAEPIMVAIQGEIAGGPIKNIYTEHAKILAKIGRYDKAMEYIDKAFLCTAHEPDLNWATNLRLLTINVLTKQKNYAEAIDSAMVLREFIQPSNTPVEKVIFQKDLLETYKSIAEIFYSRYLDSHNLDALSDAYQNYKKAAELVDVIRQSYHWKGSKLFLLRESQALYLKTIEVSLKLAELLQDKRYLEEAFVFLEKRKSILLLEALQGENAKTYGEVSSEMLAKEEKIQLMLAYYEKSLFAEKQKGEDKNPKTILRLEDQVFKYHKSYDSLMIVLKNKYPSYYRLNYSIQFRSAAEIQNNLKTKDAALIDYLLGDEIIYAFVLTPEKYEVIEIASKNLTSKIQSLQKAAFKPFVLDSLSTEQRQSYSDTLIQYSHQLYQDLIAPIVNRVDLPEKIIISPDGPLGYIPFELLLKELPGNNSNFGSHAYLLRDFQISYTYSATLLQEMQEKKYSARRKDLIAFAPLFKGPRVNPNRTVSQIREGLGQLDFNIPEVEGIINLLTGTAITGAAATEERFLKEAPYYQIIHLSTHGKANDEQGDYAYLAFSTLEDSIENEYLYNRDLYNMDLKADMVVLSACETGIGELQRGEGIISLARGFSYAGAKSIITTLWAVNDATTEKFMKQFYTYIKAGKTKDFALRQAKLDFIEEHVNEAHPFFWAPFIAIGDMAPIQLNSSFQYLYWGLGLVMALFVFWILRQRKVIKE